jgi:hypothetical protein
MKTSIIEYWIVLNIFCWYFMIPSHDIKTKIVKQNLEKVE